MAKKSPIRDYEKVKSCYLSYLRFYKKLNNGSLSGAATFNFFYFYKTFTIKYMDHNRVFEHTFH